MTSYQAWTLTGLVITILTFIMILFGPHSYEKAHHRSHTHYFQPK